MTHPIETDRLILRPRTHGDMDACLAMDRDPLVTQYIDGPWDNPDAHRAFLLGRMNAPYTPPFGYWAITLNANPNEFLGWVMALPTQSNSNQIELGWRLPRAAWGRGIGTEAARAVMDRIEQETSSMTLTAHIHPGNTGSINIAQKLGMIRGDDEAIDGNIEQVYTINF